METTTKSTTRGSTRSSRDDFTVGDDGVGSVVATPGSRPVSIVFEGEQMEGVNNPKVDWDFNDIFDSMSFRVPQSIRGFGIASEWSAVTPDAPVTNESSDEADAAEKVLALTTFVQSPSMVFEESFGRSFVDIVRRWMRLIHGAEIESMTSRDDELASNFEQVLNKDTSKAQSGINEESLFKYWMSRAKSLPKSARRQLVEASVDKFIEEADFDCDGVVGMVELTHYCLLSSEVDCCVSINDRLRTTVTTLEQLQALLLEYVTFAQRERRASRMPQPENGMAGSALGFMGSESDVSYFSFLLHRGVLKVYPVELCYYDLSGWLVKAMAPVIFGKSIEGVWHTSILTQGKELWFGGGVFVSRPFTTPFGTPVKCVNIGETLLTIPEIKEVLRDSLDRFSVNTYDVMDNNCNDFTNYVAKRIKVVRKSEAQKLAAQTLNPSGSEPVPRRESDQSSKEPNSKDLGSKDSGSKDSNFEDSGSKDSGSNNSSESGSAGRNKLGLSEGLPHEDGILRVPRSSRYANLSGIPLSVLNMPENLSAGGLARALRPILNVYLGTFQADSGSGDSDPKRKARHKAQGTTSRGEAADPSDEAADTDRDARDSIGDIAVDSSGSYCLTGCRCCTCSAHQGKLLKAGCQCLGISFLQCFTCGMDQKIRRRFATAKTYCVGLLRNNDPIYLSHATVQLGAGSLHAPRLIKVRDLVVYKKDTLAYVRAIREISDSKPTGSKVADLLLFVEGREETIFGVNLNDLRPVSRDQLSQISSSFRQADRTDNTLSARLSSALSHTSSD